MWYKTTKWNTRFTFLILLTENGKHFIKISAMQVKFQEIKLEVHTEIASTWKYFCSFWKKEKYFTAIKCV